MINNKLILKGAGYILLPFLLILDTISAQKHDYNWAFSTRWLDTNSIINFSQMDQRVLTETTNANIGISMTNTTMSDAEGNLLYICNGCSVFGNKFNLLENGDRINPGRWHNTYCPTGYVSGHQSIISLPWPNKKEQYAMIHTSWIRYLEDTILHINTDAIRLTTIKSEGSAIDEVIDKNQIILSDTNIYSGSITACKNVNNQDWWIINPVRLENGYHIWLLDSIGLKLDTTIFLGRKSRPGGETGGAAQFTPDGKKYIRWHPEEGIYIFDFDRSNGVLSNFEWVDNRVDTIQFGGMAISPNSRFLYVSTLLNLFQFDLEADDILASKVLIDTWDLHGSPFPCNFWQGQLGPDCRIYFSSTASCTELHVINKPDLKGKDCDFRQHSFSLGYSHRGSLPHFPNYRLGTDEVCNPDLIVSTQTIIKPKQTMDFYIRPNPNHGRFDIISAVDFERIEVIDMTGRIVDRFENRSSVELDVAPGIYFVKLYREGHYLGTEKVVVE